MIKNKRIRKQYNRRPLIIAHRGGGYGEKENSLGACREALKMGVDGVEIDLRMTADGVVVCHHDRGVRDRQGRRYWIDKTTWWELKKIKNGVRRFEEVVARLRRDSLIFDLDLKQEGMEKEVARILRKYKVKKVLANATDIWILKAFEDVYPQARLVLSYHPADPRDLANHKAIRFLTLLAYYSLKPLLFRLIRRKTAIGDIEAASLNFRLVNTKVVQFLHQYNIAVFVWGTEEERHLRRMVELGVEGIKTKRPDLLNKILNPKSEILNKS